MLYFGILLFFIFEYVRPARFFPVFSVLHLNTVIPLGIAVFSLKRNEAVSNADFLKLSNSKYILIFLLMIAVGVLWVDVKLYVWLRFSQVLGWFLIYLAIVKNIDSEKQLVGIFVTLALCHVILLILTPGVILRPEERVAIGHDSFLGDGNDFSLSLNIVIPFTLYLFSASDTRLLKIPCLFLTVFFVIAVVATSSRGGSLGLAAVLLYLWLKSDKKIVGLAGMALLVVLVLLYAPQSYYERMSTIQDYETEGSAHGRILAWKSAVRMATDHPLTGVGAGHFPVKYGTDYRPPGFGRTDIPWSTAHSVYFLVLGELGFPGLFVVLALIISNILRNSAIIRSCRTDGATKSDIMEKRLFVCLNSSLIGFAVSGAFLSALYYPHLYILSGIMEVARRSFYKKRENAEYGALPVVS